VLFTPSEEITMKRLALGLLLAAAVLFTPAPAAAFFTPATYSNPCLDGTAPEGWLRPGGYCEIAGYLDGEISTSYPQCKVVRKIGYGCYVKTVVGKGPLHRLLDVYKSPTTGEKVWLLHDPRQH
jgi:hypothetical protein